MSRSLRTKMVLIMVLLIVSLMTVVGAFLINSVAGFYNSDFYDQMADVFNDDDALARDLTESTGAGEDSVAMLRGVLQGYAGSLGIDGRTRNYYVLDGRTAAYLTGSDDENGPTLEITPNIASALLGQDGFASNISADYMDVALPITRGGSSYIIYIRDSRETVQSLNAKLFSLIIEALVFGLAISVLLSLLLSRTMTDPISRLTAGTRRVAEGDFSQKLEVVSQDEIGVLTGTFNDMAQQLHDTILEAENERNKLGTLFLHMTDGVVAFAADGSVIHSNPAAEELLGRAVPIGGETGYEDLFGDIAPLADVLSANPGEALTGERVRDERILELLLAPFSGESQGGVLVVIHDVTEQRRTEELRREFVANVSHELRTPLTNIRSYAETLTDSAGELPPEMEKNFLGVILSESDRMTHIVQDLLTLSRFDSGHSALSLAPFSFAEAIRSIWNSNLMEAQKHGHTMLLHLEEDLPEVNADRDRILQVMMNIVSNAIKYTPDGGHIDISAGRSGESVWMEVADDGIGIPKADRARIFERFYRVDKARSRESGGTGLGLSIAKEIIDLHRGSLSLVDRDGPGTTIRMELKIAGPDHA